MRVLIIDDEEKSRQWLTENIAKHCPTIVVVGFADCVDEGLNLIKIHKPELIFLDVEMPDGSGFDLLKQINPADFKIIFITAHAEFAVKAFKFSAIDYLLKPVNPNELVAAVERASHYKKEHNNLKYQAFLTNIFGGEMPPRKMVVKTFDSFHIVNVQDITRCEGDNNYTTLFFNDGKKIVVSKTLKEFEGLLSENGFFRIHKSHLINLHFMVSCQKSKNGNVVMKDQTTLPLSPHKKQQLLEILNNA